MTEKALAQIPSIAAPVVLSVCLFSVNSYVGNNWKMSYSDSYAELLWNKNAFISEFCALTLICFILIHTLK